MAHLKSLATATGTVACAAAIGFVMQSADRDDQVLVSENFLVSENLEVGDTSSLLEVEQITLTSGEFAAPKETETVDVPGADAMVVKASAPAGLLPLAAPQSTTPPAVAPQGSVQPGCEMIAQARPVAAAMVNLTLQADCLPNERVTVHHNGMIFSQITSADGSLDVVVPALSKDAMFILAFGNGEGAVAQTTVEELADFDRMVVQWKGDAGFQIHAREFGADYGDAGHVWADAPGDMVDTVMGQGGFITRLGNASTPEALLAEVYSFPIAVANQSGTVAVTVETEITDMNCGLEIEAQSLEVLAGAAMKTRNLTLSVPDCDATGSFLVLNNLLQDLKVASN